MNKPLTIEEFVFELPLYNIHKADEETVEKMLMQPLRFSGDIEGYHPEKNKKQHIQYGINQIHREDQEK